VNLIFLDANLLTDIRNTERMATVIYNGNVYDRQATAALPAHRVLRDTDPRTARLYSQRLWKTQRAVPSLLMRRGKLMSIQRGIQLLFTIILLVCGSVSTSAAAVSLTAQELADQAYVRAKTLDGQPYALNLADPVDYRFYMSHLARAGVNAQQRPQFFRTIEQQRQSHIAGNYRPHSEADFIVKTAGTIGDADPISVVSAINTITDVTGVGSTFSTSAVSSVNGGTQSTTITLGLYDSATHAILSPLVWGGDNSGLPLYSIVNSGTGLSSSAYAQFTYSWVDQSGTVWGPTVQAFSTSDIQPTLTNEKPKHAGGAGNVLVCLDRGNCDYGGPGTTTLVLPLKGHAVYPFGVSLTNNKPSGGSVLWKLIDATVGGGCSAFGGANSINTFFAPPTTTVVTAGNGQTTIGWDFESTVFNLPGPTCYTNGHLYNFVFLMYVPAPVQQGGPAQPVAVQVTSATPRNAGTNTVQIGQIQVVSGCLAPGTAITLADGSTLPVEKFTATGEEVRSSNDRTLTVTNYTHGPQTKPMVRIVDAAGHTLLLTEDHRVVTKNRGAVAAGALSTSDFVLTDSGPSKLTSVTRVPYHGPVHNIAVGEKGEAFGVGDTTLYANHILVGDWTMQTAANEAVRRSPEQIYAGLAPQWREDYLRSLEPAVAARLRAKKQQGGRR
jgi:hypothetical protein